MFYRLHGKNFSYRINAVIDSYISRGLIQTYFGYDVEKYSYEVKERIDAFTKISNELGSPKHFLLGAAFAQYYVNAYWDVMYPNLLEKVSLSKSPNLGGNFESISETDFGLKVLEVSYKDYFGIVKKVYQHVEKGDFGSVSKLMAESTGIEYINSAVKTSDKEAAKTSFLIGIYLTEEFNKAYNSHVLTKYYRGKKISLIEEVSNSYGPAFKKGAFATQLAAGRWDKLFLRLFRLKYREVFSRPEIIEFIENKIDDFNKSLKS